MSVYNNSNENKEDCLLAREQELENETEVNKLFFAEKSDLEGSKCVKQASCENVRFN